MSVGEAREALRIRFNGLFRPGPVPSIEDGNFVQHGKASEAVQQSQTNDAFSVKWDRVHRSDDKATLYEMQKRWYLSLYGFASEIELAAFLRARPVILDAGCGLGYKAAWFAELAPGSLIVGIDYSDAARQAASAYRHLPNLFFMQGDIADVPFRDGSVSYVSCDQVIMHTQDPDATFAELTRLTDDQGGQFACYFYARKALPRELLDDYFRRHCLEMSSEQLWEMSEQLTELGRRLSELRVEVDVPAIPALGIKAGRQDVQRFIYWNLIKCFWNEELGRETSVVVNFDWYSPSNARRYSEQEVRGLAELHHLRVEHFHAEEACYSCRFERTGEPGPRVMQRHGAG
jgi:SAM-dependent methyltransferase